MSWRENRGSNKLVSKTNIDPVLVEQFQLSPIEKISRAKDATQGSEINQPHEPITNIDHDQVLGRGSRIGTWKKFVEVLLNKTMLWRLLWDLRGVV